MTALKRTKTYIIASTSLTSIALLFALLPPPAPRVGELSIIVRKPIVQHTASTRAADESATQTDATATVPELAYDIDRVRAGELDVPHIFLASLPADLVNVPTPAQRKDMFVAMTLPLVLRANDEILADRARLLKITGRVNTGATLNRSDRTWLAALADRYGTDADDLAELAKRVDVVPPSLALAQAAEESGWGTSRFAHEGNALFGQRSTPTDADALAATGRDDNDAVRVRAYGDLIDGVRSYARNLNTHPAYARFRQERARARTRGEPIDGHDLAGTLVRYSERGADYVSSLRHLIRYNRLNDFDDARLDVEFAVAAGKI